MNGTHPSDHFMAHCRREVLHAQWEILLDDEFVYAYEHGIVINCCDGITRQFYPRIITYSADYKEKCVSLCSIHLLSDHRLRVGPSLPPSAVAAIVPVPVALYPCRGFKTWA